MSDNTRTTPNMTDGTQQEIIRMDSLNVHDRGRVIIPTKIRDHHGLIERQLLQLRLVVDGERESFTGKMVSGGRVTIPNRLREKHDIDDGDDADVELVV